MKKITLILVVMTLFLSSCVEEKRVLSIKSDLSGFYATKMIIDFTEMVDMLLTMKSPNISEEERGFAIEAAKREMQSKIEGGDDPKMLENQEAFKQKISELEGIDLIKFDVAAKDGKMVLVIKVAFDHVRYLAQLTKIDLNTVTPQNQMMDQGAMPIPGANKKQERPFFDLEIKETGDTLTIAHLGLAMLSANKSGSSDGKEMEKAMSELKKLDDMSEMMPGLGTMMEKAFQGMKSSYLIRLPYLKYKLAKHNADDEKKNALQWNYAIAEIMEMAKKGKMPKMINVILKKK